MNHNGSTDDENEELNLGMLPQFSWIAVRIYIEDELKPHIFFKLITKYYQTIKKLSSLKNC